MIDPRWGCTRAISVSQSDNPCPRADIAREPRMPGANTSEADDQQAVEHREIRGTSGLRGTLEEDGPQLGQAPAAPLFGAPFA